MIHKLLAEHQLPSSFVMRLARRLDSMTIAEQNSSFEIISAIVELLPRELKRENRLRVEGIALDIFHIFQLSEEVRLLSWHVVGPQIAARPALSKNYFETLFDLANEHPELELHRDTLLQWVDLIGEYVAADRVAINQCE